MKKKYEKPEAEKISFSIEDTLMDNGGTGEIPPITGSGTGGVTPPWSLDDSGYQLH